MKISIIVPAYNEEKLIPGTLQAIRHAGEALAARGWECELIVCDNNSTDRTAELARSAGANVVFEPVNQIGRARNTGAAAATGDWLLFVDADSHPSPPLFADMVAAIQTGRYLAGGCTLRLDSPQLVGRLASRVCNSIMRTGKLLAGSFIFCEAAAFREIGGFNLELFASEEIDLSRRLKRLARDRGKKLVILHRHPLVTSARKLHLYSAREHAKFLSKTLWNWRGTLRNRDACHSWYDGRR